MPIIPLLETKKIKPKTLTLKNFYFFFGCTGSYVAAQAFSLVATSRATLDVQASVDVAQ